MDEPSLPPVKAAIPSPDLSQPPLPPVEDGIKPDQQNATSAYSEVPVRVVAAAEADALDSQAGSLAPFNTRIIAALIDMLVASGLYIAVAWFLPGFAARLAWLVMLGYLVARDSLPFMGGQSVGKKAMKLRTVTLNGKSLVNNWEPAIIRNAVLAIPLFGFVEFVILLTREGKPEHGRRLGDEWAKTQVIIDAGPPAAE